MRITQKLNWYFSMLSLPVVVQDVRDQTEKILSHLSLLKKNLLDVISFKKVPMSKQITVKKL